MAYRGVQGRTGAYRGVQGRTGAYRGVQGRTGAYRGVQVCHSANCISLPTRRRLSVARQLLETSPIQRSRGFNRDQTRILLNSI